LGVPEAATLELDELWSFVWKKARQRGLWLALCRQTRHVVAFVIGDSSEQTCRRLWQARPDACCHAHGSTDCWEASAQVRPAEPHTAVGTDSGESVPSERWHLTLRPRRARFVRRT